jgi:hypothetical protein
VYALDRQSAPAEILSTRNQRPVMTARFKHILRCLLYDVSNQKPSYSAKIFVKCITDCRRTHWSHSGPSHCRQFPPHRSGWCKAVLSSQAQPEGKSWQAGRRDAHH